MTIRERILIYLQEHGIQQSFLASRCGWTKQKVHCMLHNKQNMTVEDYALICDALQLPYGYFYDLTSKSA